MGANKAPPNKHLWFVRGHDVGQQPILRGIDFYTGSIADTHMRQSHIDSTDCDTELQEEDEKLPHYLPINVSIP